mmetsp:Transcript_15094/g.25020  ORF Transcript_15094/g.25020 Transcript_15094/m.25020 type:complete len:214 (+) Transcript_15094:168-809(+)
MATKTLKQLNHFNRRFSFVGLACHHHIQLNHTLLSQVIKPGDTVIDATVGNGNDTLFLSRVLSGRTGKLYGFDIQQVAIDNTRRMLLDNLSTADKMDQVLLSVRNHKTFPAEIQPRSVKAIVYNLGYLPGQSSDKSIKTESADTVQSITNALDLVSKGGLVSIMCYRGHDGGREEASAVAGVMAQLCPREWKVFSHDPLNQPTSPVLVTVFKK